MGPDAIAAMEARLLAVERRCVRLEDDTRQLARGMNLSRQRTWESWTDFRARPPAVVVAGHPAVSCGANLPDSIPFSDPYMGVSDSLDWDSGSGTWKKCVDGIAWPPAPSIVFALHYEFGWASGTQAILSASWKASTALPGGAPLASTCATATNSTVAYAGSTETCPPPTYQKLFIARSGQGFLTTLYQASSTNRTITVGPVAPA